MIASCEAALDKAVSLISPTHLDDGLFKTTCNYLRLKLALLVRLSPQPEIMEKVQIPVADAPIVQERRNSTSFFNRMTSGSKKPEARRPSVQYEQ